MRVREVMTSTHLAVARAGDELALAVQMMLWSDAHHLPVVRDDGTVVGVVSARDLLRQPKEESGFPASHVTVEEVMSYPPVTVAPDTPLPSAVTMMLDRKIGCLPVVDHGALVGVLTTTDLLRNQLETLIDRPAARLPPTVRELMKPAPAVVMADNEIFDAAALMGSRRVRHLPVVDRQRRVVGILSDRDVRAALGDPARFPSEPDERERVRGTLVEHVMSRDVVTVQADAPVTTAIDHLTHDGVGALPVVAEDGKLAGMLSYLDVIQALQDRL
jgi:CBS domain-containing protein